MFNSQKINNDPKPYEVDFGLALGTVRSERDEGSHWDSHDTNFDPRPEYDNNPNPLLEAFRDFLKIVGGGELQEKAQNVLDNGIVWDSEIHQGAHIDHARKVLERLANVYSD